MNDIEFTNLKAEFQKVDIEGKINLYINTEGLSREQYKELLKMYPINQLNKLENALK